MKKNLAAIPMTELNEKLAVLFEGILDRYYRELDACFAKYRDDEFVKVVRHGLQFFFVRVRPDGTTVTKQTPILDDLFGLTADSKIIQILKNPDMKRTNSVAWDAVLGLNLFDYKDEILGIYGF